MPGELAKAVCNVMLKVRFIPETGVNQHQKYKYASDEDLLAALQPAMAEEGLCMIPTACHAVTTEHSDTRSGNKQWRTEVRETFTLMHTSGETLVVESSGCGVDGEDKGVYKAMTGALKYALRHTFLVPTGEDAERTEPREKPQPTQKAPPAQRAPPAPPGNPDGLRRAFFAKWNEVFPKPTQKQGYTKEEVEAIEIKHDEVYRKCLYAWFKVSSLNDVPLEKMRSLEEFLRTKTIDEFKAAIDKVVSSG